MKEANRFHLTDDEYEGLIAVLGRSDAPAHHYVRDLEQLADVWPHLLSMPGEVQLPPEIRGHLQGIANELTNLGQRLYALPDDTRALLALHLISEDTGRRIRRDLHDLDEPLADLTGVLRRLAAGEVDGDFAADQPPETLFHKTLARCYRNHFNVNVDHHPTPDFDDTVRLLIEDMEAHGLPGVGALRSLVLGDS